MEVKLECASAPKAYNFEIYFGDTNPQKYFETEAEHVSRLKRLQNDQPLVYSDFESKYVNQNDAIKSFILSLRETCKLHEIDLV